MLSDWISRGELNDLKNEFFIKSNPKVFKNEISKAGKEHEKISSKNQWRESFIFRTINLKEIMQSGGFFVDNTK